MQAIESLFTMAGLYTPVRRFFGIGILTGAVLYWVQPDSMFFDGSARGWSLLGPEDDGIPATSLPWWLAAGIAGALAATVI